MVRQLRVSKTVAFFREGLVKRWGLTDYTDIHAPCLFFGVGNAIDVQAVRSHRGLKIVWFVNARCMEVIDYLKGIKDMVIIDNPYLTRRDFRIKKVIIDIKDYSDFKPVPLGNTVYMYVGNDRVKINYGYDIAMRLNLKHKIVFGKQGNTIEEMRDKFYANAFVNLNLSLNGGGGLTTAHEMNAMGRKTIIRSLYDFPHFIHHNGNIKELIEKEAEKIGTIQQPINYNSEQQWQREDFWL